MIVTAFFYIAALLVVARCVCITGAINKKNWAGHPVQFICFALGIALTGAGATATALHCANGSNMLLTGIAFWLVFDRRKYGRCFG